VARRCYFRRGDVCDRYSGYPRSGPSQLRPDGAPADGVRWHGFGPPLVGLVACVAIINTAGVYAKLAAAPRRELRAAPRQVVVKPYVSGASISKGFTISITDAEKNADFGGISNVSDVNLGIFQF
jgi:hypothetical protein